MAAQLLSMGSLDLGVPHHRDEGFLTFTVGERRDPEFPHAQLLKWSGGKLSDIDMVPWNCVALAVPRSDVPEMFAIGELGQVNRFISGQRIQEQIPVATEPDARGPLRSARAIADQIYVVGMDCQVFRRTGQGQWQSIDQALRQKPALADVPGLETVFGNDPASVFAAGWRGTILHYHNDIWDIEQSPTNAILTDGVQIDDGRAIICGRQGTIVVGEPGLWEVIDHPFKFADFWGVAQIRGRIILSSYTGLFELLLADKEVRRLVVNTNPEPTTFGRLAAAPDVMWSVGTKDLIEFDGTNWSKLI